MGGKSQSMPSPPPIQGGSSTMGMSAMLPMVQMMQSMMEASMSHMAPPMPAQIVMPPAIPPPPVFSSPVVSFDAELAKANVEAANEAFEERDLKKGRLDTILTSPLLDEEDVETTQSLLGGANVRP